MATCIQRAFWVDHLSKYFSNKVGQVFDEDNVVDAIIVIKDKLVDAHGGEMAEIVDEAVRRGTGKSIQNPFFNPKREFNAGLISDKLRTYSVDGIESDLGFSDQESDDGDEADLDDRGFITGATHSGGKVATLTQADFETMWIAATDARLTPKGFNQLMDIIRANEDRPDGFERFLDTVDGSTLDGVDISLKKLPIGDNAVFEDIIDSGFSIPGFLELDRVDQLITVQEYITDEKLAKTFLNNLYESQSAIRNLKMFYHSMRSDNRVANKDKRRYIFTNLNFPKLNQLIKSGKDIVQSIRESIKSSPSFGRRLQYNLEKKKLEGEFDIKSFIDHSKEKIRDFKISDVTASFSIAQMIKLVPTKNPAFGYFTTGYHKDISEDTIMSWEYELANTKNSKGSPTPMVIVGLSPGDNGDVYLTNLQKSQLDEVVPKQEFIKKLKQADGFEKATIKWVENELKTKSIYATVLKLQEKYSQTQDQMRDSFRKPRIIKANFKGVGDLLDNESKTQTTRKKKLGRVNDVFKVGKSYYKITKVRSSNMTSVITDDYQAEGFADPLDLIKDLTKIGWKGVSVKSKRKVVVTEFQKIDEAAAKELLAKEDSPKYSTQVNRGKNLSSLMHVIGSVANDNMIKYFNKQVRLGYMTKEQADEMIETAKKSTPFIRVPVMDSPLVSNGKTYLHPILHYAGIIAKHEWMQGVRGKDYMLDKDGDVFNIFDRLRIPISKGLITQGLGPSRNILYDQDKVDYYLDGELYEHIIDIPGIGITNIFDGASFSSENYLDDTAYNIGVNKVRPDEHNLREIKTVNTEITNDENGQYQGYIERKHAEHSAIPGLEIRDKKTGEVIAKMETVYGKTRILDKDGKSIDTISDLDATKAYRGIYNIKKQNKSHMQFDLQEESRRVIITPHTKSAEDVSMFVQFLTSLNVPGLEGQAKKDFDKYSKVIYKLLSSQSDQYLELFENVTQDKDRFWSLVKHMFSKKANLKHNLEQLLSKTKGAGLLFEGNMASLRPVLLNRLIRRGSMQARTLSKGLSGIAEGSGTKGSHYVLKPGKRVDEGKVILSADNHVIWDEVVSQLVDDMDNFNSKGKAEQVGIINDLISKGKDLKVLTWRFPILQIAAVETRSIQEFSLEDGNAVYHHPEDTFRRLIGDNDIDEAGVALISNADAKAMEGFYETEWYKAQKTANPNIGMVDTGKAPRYSNVNDTRTAMVDLIHGFNAQGMATNLRAVASTLSMKFKEIKFNDGVIVTPKILQSADRKEDVVMDYAPIRPEVSEDEIPSFASFVNEKGQKWRAGDENKFLKTNAEHEFLLVTNAAVDNLKKGTLTRTMGARNPLWFTEKVFNVRNGVLTDDHLKILREIVNQFKYSNIKRLRHGASRYKISVTGKTNNLLNILGSLDDNLEMSPKEKVVEFQEIAPAKMTNEGLRISEVDYNNQKTYEEKFVLKFYERYKQAFIDSEGTAPIPLLLDEVRQKNTAQLAKEVMLLELAKDNSLTNDAIEKGLNMAHEFSAKFYKSLESLSTGETKTDKESEDDHIVSKQAEYDKELFGMVVDMLPQLESEVDLNGDGAWKVFTTALIYGLGARSNIQYLPPVEVLHERTLMNFFNAFDNIWDKRDSDGNLFSTTISNTDKKAKASQLTSQLIKIKMKECS